MLKTEILPNLSPAAPNDKQKTIVQLVSSVARLSTQQISPVVGQITPAIVQSLQKEDEELRESCLQVQSFLYRRWIRLRVHVGVGVTGLPLPYRNFLAYFHCDTGWDTVHQVRSGEPAHIPP
jgi:hypothetical protein